MENNKSGTILVVEDEPGVRDVTVQMLEFAGFDVIEAVDAASGLQRFKENPQIDLVFTDVIMPGGTSGIEMSKEILVQNPHTLILLATGYLDKAEALIDKAAHSSNIAVVAKPYDINIIPDLISSMISSASAEPL
ncbi:MAG: response regulator [Gammaproteobacteria bacterium]|nr:response regulator [Gammaproteobacteria bacterium]